MTETYVTLFDSTYLPQGLALYQSLIEHAGEFELWVICVDDDCYSFLEQIKSASIHPLRLSELETDSLIDIKYTRTKTEYCWSLTPWSIQWVFSASDSVERVTYLDADTILLSSPKPIFDAFEASGKSFLVMEHGYSPRYDQTLTSGRYCVQFVPVLRGAGEVPLHWWRDRCLEWCYFRLEDGKMGDQMYFESLVEKFPSEVLSLGSDHRFLAPWNIDYYRFSDAIFYHFQGFRIINASTFLLSLYYPIPRPVLNNVYKPYIRFIQSLPSKYPSLKLRRQVKLNFRIIISMIVSFVLSPIRNIWRVLISSSFFFS